MGWLHEPVRVYQAAILALTLSLTGCQGIEQGSTRAEGPPETSSAIAPSNASAPVPVSSAATELAESWSAEKPAGASSAVAEPGRTGLSQAEFYQGTGELIRRRDEGVVEAPISEDGKISLNFADADIREVIDVVLGDSLQLNYIIDPRVQGTVLARTSQPLERKDVLPALESILALNGVALQLVEDVYHVVPIGQAGGGLGGLRTVISPDQRAYGFAVTIIPLKFVAADAVHRITAGLVPPERIYLPDPARNLLIFAGTGAEARDLVDLVRLFDVDWMAGMSFALLPVEVADAANLAAELDLVFGQEAEGPLQGVIRFVPIKRLNAILVISPQRAYLERAEAWVKRLDRGEQDARRRVYVYYVQNSRAAELAKVLSQIYEGGTGDVPLGEVAAPDLTPVELTSPVMPTSGEATKSQESEIGATAVAERPSGAGPRRRDEFGEAAVGALVSESGKIRLIADERNNALVVLATPSEYRMIEATLQRLDIVPLQVLIEATIAEVTLDDQLKYGLQWFFSQGDVSGSFSTLDSGAVVSGFPGFSFLFDSNNARVVLNALTDITDLRVISSPQLMVLDNQPALLNVGDQVPIATQSSVSITNPDAPIVNSIEYRDTGVTLEITPRVNASGLVVLDIVQEVSDAIETDTSDINSPTIQQRRIESTVAVQSHETVALGGLIRDRAIENVTGIPLLSDIPILGNLFKTTDEQTRRTELLVLITPSVIRNLEEARDVTEELRDRLSVLEPLEQRIGYGQGPEATQ